MLIILFGFFQLNEQLLEFIKIVSNSSGRIVSTRLNEKYFTKIDKLDIWDYFHTFTSSFGDDCSIGDRIIFLKNGYLDRPKCVVCGKPVVVVDRKVSKYCSKQCANKDPNKSNVIKESLKNVDYSKANEKRKETMLSKYGVEYNSQRNDIHHLWNKTKLDESTFNLLNDVNWLNEQYNILNKSALEIGKMLGVDFSTVLFYCRKHNFKIKHGYNSSLIEKEIREFLTSHNIEFISNYVGLYDDKREVDIFIPSHNLAIEVNGLYYHKEDYKDRNYHRNKKRDVKSNISLIMVTDKQWNEQKEVVKSIILNKLNLISSRFFARKMKLEVFKHTTKEITSFFNENHIDRFASGNLYIVLKDKDSNNIVCGGVFGKSRFESNTDELIRFASKTNTICIGGMSRILKHYRILRPNTTLISYVNLDLFDGSSYEKNPVWIRTGNVSIGYYYTNGTQIISRQKAQKQSMMKWNKEFESKLTETENMAKLGFYRYWDCGKVKFKLRQTTHTNE